MKMKKFLSAILSLTLLAGILSVIPISAEAVFISNMSGWRKVTGSWDFSTGRAQSTTSNNQAVCSTSVDKSDNWMWNTDISYADTSTTVLLSEIRLSVGFRTLLLFADRSYRHIKSGCVLLL